MDASKSQTISYQKLYRKTKKMLEAEQDKNKALEKENQELLLLLKSKKEQPKESQSKESQSKESQPKNNKEQERNDILEKKNKYLNAKINIFTNNKNKGEKDEVLLLLKLYHLNEMNEFEKLVEIFGEEASKGISILDIDTNDEIVDINNLSKAKSCYKADFKMRMKKTLKIYTPSIKSKNGANPAIINHTPRNAKIFQEDGIFYNDISYLDKILAEYIDKRVNKKIGEDTLISKLMCLKNHYSLKEIFLKLLSYFVFDGTGKGYSKCRANAIIEYHNDKITFKNCDDIEKKNEYIKSIYDTLVISLRDKCMPKVMNEYCKPWVFDDIKPDGSIKHKGSLHIRIK